MGNKLLSEKNTVEKLIDRANEKLAGLDDGPVNDELEDYLLRNNIKKKTLIGVWKNIQMNYLQAIKKR